MQQLRLPLAEEVGAESMLRCTAISQFQRVPMCQHRHIAPSLQEEAMTLSVVQLAMTLRLAGLEEGAAQVRAGSDQARRTICCVIKSLQVF
jgi:hypothetical protein